MSTLNRHVALVSESPMVGVGALMRVAAAMQKQATRDLGPIWQVSATVDAFERLEDVPVDYWPVIIMDDIGYDAAGIHLDHNGQPFSLVNASADENEWSLTTAHEILEMLVDPFGNRVVASDSPKPGQGRVNILVEVCDPSEAAEFAYSVNGVLVSDFYTPAFLDPAPAAGVRYSFTGALKAPRQVLKGGYISWLDLSTNHWWQKTWFGGAAPTYRDLGVFPANACARAEIDRRTSKATAEAVSQGRASAKSAGMAAMMAAPAANGRVAMLRQQIGSILAASGS